MNLSEERAARNEALFREVNEQVRWLASDEQSRAAADFICECSDDTCTDRLHVPLRAYESVRAYPRRFIIRPGHESAYEHVVERNDTFLVVEKEGQAGQVAERNDPRG